MQLVRGASSASLYGTNSHTAATVSLAPTSMTVVAVVGALNSVIALYYYVRVLKNMYLEKSEQSAPIVFSRAQRGLVLALVVPVFLLGVYFSPLAELAQASVRIFGTP